MTENDENMEETGKKEYKTTNSAFAAYLAAKKLMFLQAEDTGKPLGRGKAGTMKRFVFYVDQDEDMEAHSYNFHKATDESKVPAIVMANKMRLIHQSYRKLESSSAKA